MDRQRPWFAVGRGCFSLAPSQGQRSELLADIGCWAPAWGFPGGLMSGSAPANLVQKKRRKGMVDSSLKVQVQEKMHFLPMTEACCYAPCSRHYSCLCTPAWPRWWSAQDDGNKALPWVKKRVPKVPLWTQVLKGESVVFRIHVRVFFSLLPFSTSFITSINLYITTCLLVCGFSGTGDINHNTVCHKIPTTTTLRRAIPTKVTHSASLCVLEYLRRAHLPFFALCLSSQDKGFLPFLNSPQALDTRWSGGSFESCHQTKAIFQLSASSDSADQEESLHRPGSRDLLFLLDREFSLQSHGIPRKGLYENPSLGSASIRRWVKGRDGSVLGMQHEAGHEDCWPKCGTEFLRRSYRRLDIYIWKNNSIISLFRES